MQFDTRKLKWISSTDVNNVALLSKLNTAMIEFYSKPKSRDSYQEMVDNIDNDLDNPGLTTISFIEYLKTIKNKNILEVGCGSGRIYQFIKKYLENFNYTGIELSEKVITQNKLKYQNANWFVAGTYDIPAQINSQDVCCSFYVLEHLVYPENALKEMLRVVKKGGHLILIFPDFISSKKFASQGIGLSNYGKPKDKLKKGKILDTLFSLYDSRIRLPNALANAHKIGKFLININPICLYSNSSQMSPDIDAVYLASKKEVKEWAESNGHEVCYPFGETGHFLEHSFVSIKKS